MARIIIDGVDKSNSEITSLTELSDVTITSVANDDLLQFNSTSSEWENVTKSSFSSFADNTFNIFDESDNTKELAFDVGTLVGTGNTSTIQIPDLNGVMALMGVTQSTNFTTTGTIFAGTIDLGTNTITDGTMVGDWDFSAGNLTTTGNMIILADGDGTDSTLKLGLGNDLKLYHDGSNSFIENLTGDTKVLVQDGNAFNIGIVNFVPFVGSDASTTYKIFDITKNDMSGVASTEIIGINVDVGDPGSAPTVTGFRFRATGGLGTYVGASISVASGVGSTTCLELQGASNSPSADTHLIHMLPTGGSQNLDFAVLDESGGAWDLGASIFTTTGKVTTGECEINGALNHDGSTAGFYGTAPIAQAILATGAGSTVDNVITALQNLGLVKQS